MHLSDYCIFFNGKMKMKIFWLILSHQTVIVLAMETSFKMASTIDAFVKSSWRMFVKKKLQSYYLVQICFRLSDKHSWKNSNWHFKLVSICNGNMIYPIGNFSQQILHSIPYFHILKVPVWNSLITIFTTCCRNLNQIWLFKSYKISWGVSHSDLSSINKFPRITSFKNRKLWEVITHQFVKNVPCSVIQIADKQLKFTLLCN